MTFLKNVMPAAKHIQKKAFLNHKSQHALDNICNVCDKIFATSRKLKLHSKSHTCDKKRFKCNLCAVACPTAYGLRVHKLTHTGERPYRCDKCQSRFSRLAAMKKHKSNVHQAADCVTYSCTNCDAVFSVRGNLLRHYLLVHQGLRRFICGLCGWQHSQNQDLRRHLLHKHQVEGTSILGADKKPLGEIYVLPSIDNLPRTDPIVSKIRSLVEKEKQKLQHVEDLLLASGATKQPGGVCEDQEKHLAETSSRHESKQSGHITTSKGKRSKKTHTCVDVGIQSDQLETWDRGVVQPITSSPQFIEQFVVCVLHEEMVSCPGVNSCEVSSHPRLSDAVKESENVLQCQHCGLQFLDEEAFSSHRWQRQSLACPFCSTHFCNDNSLHCHLQDKHAVMVYCCGICMIDLTGHELFVSHMMDIHRISVTSPEPSGTSLPGTTETASDDVSAEHRVESYGSRISATAPAESVEFDGDDVVLPRRTPVPPVSSCVRAVDSRALPVAGTEQPNTGSKSGLTRVPALGSEVSLQSGLTKSCVDALNHHQMMDTVCEVPTLPDDSNVPVSSTSIPSNVETIQLPLMLDLQQSPGKAFVCKLCGKQFGSLEMFEEHTCNRDTTLHSCSTCEKFFKDKSNLKVHMRSHTGEKPYACSICDKKFRYQKEVVEHKRMHDGLLPYVCDRCGRQFSRLRVLVRHKQIHAAVKKYKCPECDKAFSRLDQLKYIHMPTHLPEGEKPQEFACSECDKRFMLKSKLTQHQILHTGEKKYKCDICSRSFALNIYLKSHLETHRKQICYVECPKCPRKFASDETLEVHYKTFHERMDRLTKRMKEQETSDGMEDLQVKEKQSSQVLQSTREQGGNFSNSDSNRSDHA